MEYHYDSTKDLDEDYKAALKSSQYVIRGCVVDLPLIKEIFTGSDRPTKRKSTTPISEDSCSETYLEDIESTGNTYTLSKILITGCYFKPEMNLF